MHPFTRRRFLQATGAAALATPLANSLIASREAFAQSGKVLTIAYNRTKRPAPGLKVLPYREDKLIVVVPKGHALAKRPSVKLTDVLPYDLVGVQKGSSIDTLVVKSATELGQPVKLRIRASGFDAVSRMVEAGLGVGIMPDLVAMNYTPAMKIEMVKLDEPWAARQLNICIRDLDSLSAAAGLLVRHLSKR